MLGYIMEGVKDHSDDAEIAAFLRRILRKEAGDGSGLIYGMGHAVYTKSDPRAVILAPQRGSIWLLKRALRMSSACCAPWSALGRTRCAR